MSAPTTPFAKGYGVLLGLLVLWAGTLPTFFLILFLIKVIKEALWPGGEGTS